MSIRDQIMQRGQGIFADVVDHAIDMIGGSYDSEIERMLAVAFHVARQMYFHEAMFYGQLGKTEAEARDFALPCHFTRNYDASIFPQVTIGKYRVDFLVLYVRGLEGQPLGGIVVECDGHEFHEKTKKQAARDKSRDRDLQEAGLKVFRFTGAEIWANPFGCASQILKLACSWSEHARNARVYTSIGHHSDAADALSRCH